MRTSSLHRLACAPLAIVVAAGLSACSNEVEQPEPETSASPTPTVEESSEAETTTSAKQRRRRTNDPELVAQVQEQFSTLAPPTLFKALDSCSETSLKGSYDCSGPVVGKFQFFESETMARDTAEVVTGLSSSRVVEQTDEKVVGWSMLGKTAVITVVDLKNGKVMQQIMPSDEGDPEERIYKLGLAEDDGSGVSTPQAPSESSQSNDADDSANAEESAS